MTAAAEVDAKSNKADVAQPTPQTEQAHAGEQTLANHALDTMNRRPGDSATVGEHHDAIGAARDNMFGPQGHGDSVQAFKQYAQAKGNEGLHDVAFDGDVQKASFNPNEGKKLDHIDVAGNKPGEQPLDVQRNGNEMTVNRGNESFTMNRDHDSRDFKDGKGNEIKTEGGQMTATSDHETYDIDRAGVRQHMDGGFSVYHQKGAGDDPSQSQRDQLVAKPDEKGNQQLALSDNTGEVRTTAEQNGNRTFHIHDQGQTDDKQTVNYDTNSKKLTIHNATDGQDTSKDVTLTSDGKQWSGTNPATGKPYTEAEMQAIQINGRSITQNQDIQISGNGANDGTTIGLDGNVHSQIQGKAVTVAGAGALDAGGNPVNGVNATIDKGDGTTASVLAQGNQTNTREITSQGQNVQTAFGPQGMNESMVVPDGKGGSTTQSDFRLAYGDQAATAQLGPQDAPTATFNMTAAPGDGNNYQFQQASTDMGIVAGSPNPNNPDSWQLNGNYWTNGDWSQSGDQLGNMYSSSGDGYSQIASSDGSSDGSYADGTDGTDGSYSFDATAGAAAFTADASITGAEEQAVASDASGLVSSASDGTPDTSKMASLESDYASLSTLMAALPAGARFDGLRASIGASMDSAKNAMASADNQKDRLGMAEQAAQDGASDSDVAARAAGLSANKVASIRGDETNPFNKKREEQEQLSA